MSPSIAATAIAAVCAAIKPRMATERPPIPSLALRALSMKAAVVHRHERAPSADRQRLLVYLVAKGEGRLRRPEKQFVPNAIAQFVLGVGCRKVGRRVPPWAAFDRDDVETFVGQLLREDRARPAEADNRHVLVGELARHGSPSGFARIPLRPSHKADGRTGVALVMTLDPVAVIVTSAGIADHALRAHVAIAAVNRVGEKSLVHVC